MCASVLNTYINTYMVTTTTTWLHIGKHFGASNGRGPTSFMLKETYFDPLTNNKSLVNAVNEEYII